MEKYNIYKMEIQSNYRKIPMSQTPCKF